MNKSMSQSEFKSLLGGYLHFGFAYVTQKLYTGSESFAGITMAVFENEWKVAQGNNNDLEYYFEEGENPGDVLSISMLNRTANTIHTITFSDPLNWERNEV